MTKLSDTQLLILSAAAQRDDGNVLPVPASLRGGAATKVVGALLTRGLIAEQATEAMTRADPAANGIWRNDEDGRAILLHITEAGLAAIGVEPEDAPSGSDNAPQGAIRGSKGRARAKAAAEAKAATRAGKAGRAGKGAADAGAAAKTRTPRENTKQTQVIAMLRRAKGATIQEIVDATGWQQHTVRGVFAGALKKKLGLDVSSEKVEGRGRVYRIV